MSIRIKYLFNKEIIKNSITFGAALSLFSPPPLTNKKTKGFSSIKAHKFLANIHFTAMILTNVVADDNKKAHKAAAYTAFASYATAVIVFKF